MGAYHDAKQSVLHAAARYCHAATLAAAFAAELEPEPAPRRRLAGSGRLRKSALPADRVKFVCYGGQALTTPAEIISLVTGVQSSVMLLMAKADVTTAQTRRRDFRRHRLEPQAVCSHLDGWNSRPPYRSTG